jgi:hypothetical protein
MEPQNVTISVVNGVLVLTPATLALAEGEFVQWCVEGKEIGVVRLTAASSPFGGAVDWAWDVTQGLCYPCPAELAATKGTFKYSVCACVGAAPNKKSLVTVGQLDVS